MANKEIVKFETKSCGRCGGGGRYSYCQMYGDRCFKCGGSGRVMTKAGASAAAMAQAKRDELYGRMPADVKVGDMVWFDANMFIKGGWKIITASEPELLNNGRFWTLQFAGCTASVDINKPVRVWTKETGDAVTAYIRTLPGVIISQKGE